MNKYRHIITITFLLLASTWPSNGHAARYGRTITMDKLVEEFCNFIETQPYYNRSSIQEEEEQINQLIYELENWKDKKSFIADKDLEGQISAMKDSLDYHTSHQTSLTTKFIDSYARYQIQNRDAAVDSVASIVDGKLAYRKRNITKLEECVNRTMAENNSAWSQLDWKLIGLCAWLSLMIFALALWFFKASKKNRNHRVAANSSSNHISTEQAASAIIVRRKTAAILKTQSLEDVIDNPAYKQIDCNDFCQDSAVRRIYIKNTCIKDIYNMYAEDLRNPDNPKEDGCMVLGRWVFDSETNEYYVSLEHIVLPGDDAVFAEYELNFGGKIKMKVREKLRKLRRETNLQYDLTCWVHSHPGLGVFFSNSDANVQMQLKDPNHPNFLTAIVVDILTPEQEFGIFTFKSDSTINSKSDLTKLYSLEEFYQWAIESERNSFNRDNHINCLANAKSHTNDFSAVQLSNSTIIDLGMLIAEPTNSFVGIVQGYPHHEGLNTEYITTKVSKEEGESSKELIGCFITAQHCSIPTVRKTLANYLDKIKFVLVYSAADGMLTTIPVQDKALCTDENYYSEQKFEELKIWTRRKR